MAKSTRTRGGIADEVGLVAAELERGSLLSEQSLPRLLDLVHRFVGFAVRGFGTSTLGDVDAGTSHGFVTARTSSGDPAVATMHLRRSTLRLLFRIARELDLVEGDPTIDLDLPPRSGLKARPLTDDEDALCRSFSLHTLTSTRPSAAWALAEATATTSEMPQVRVRDLDLDNGRVWIAGGKATDPRCGHVDEWGQLQLERRLRALPDRDPDRPVVYEGTGSPESRQASSCIAISDTIVRAGLGGEPDVKPSSVIAWVGARLLAEGAGIDEVTRRLGRRSLDRTARFIGWDWTTDG